MNKVSDALEALKVRVQSIAAVGKKTFIAYDPDDLLRQITALPAPSVGLVYLGMQALEEGGSGRQGRAVSATFGLYLLFDAPSIVPSSNQKANALELLNDIRKAVLSTTNLGGNAPGGHKWRFVLENMEDASKDRAVWAQRWETPLILES